MSNPKKLGVVAGEDDKGVAAAPQSALSRSYAQALWAGPDQRRVQWRAQLSRNRIDIDIDNQMFLACL